MQGVRLTRSPPSVDNKLQSCKLTIGGEWGQINIVAAWDPGSLSMNRGKIFKLSNRRSRVSRPPRRRNSKQSSGTCRAGAKGLAATSRSTRTPRHLLLYPSFIFVKYVPLAILMIDAAQLSRNEYEASYEIFFRTASPVPKILTVASLRRVSPEDGNA